MSLATQIETLLRQASTPYTVAEMSREIGLPDSQRKFISSILVGMVKKAIVLPPVPGYCKVTGRRANTYIWAKQFSTVGLRDRIEAILQNSPIAMSLEEICSSLNVSLHALNSIQQLHDAVEQMIIFIEDDGLINRSSNAYLNKIVYYKWIRVAQAKPKRSRKPRQAKVNNPTTIDPTILKIIEKQRQAKEEAAKAAEERMRWEAAMDRLQRAWITFRSLTGYSGKDMNEAKAKYRKAALALHPDRGGDSSRFADLNSAYNTIKTHYANV